MSNNSFYILSWEIKWNLTCWNFSMYEAHSFMIIQQQTKTEILHKKMKSCCQGTKLGQKAFKFNLQVKGQGNNRSYIFFILLRGRFYWNTTPWRRNSATSQQIDPFLLWNRYSIPANKIVVSTVRFLEWWL